MRGSENIKKIRLKNNGEPWNVSRKKEGEALALASRLVWLREALGYTRYRMGKELGISDHNIKMYETGSSYPNMTTFYKFKELAKSKGIEWAV